jgi:uncharacterized membrane protein YhiD involved in acid resistance
MTTYELMLRLAAALAVGMVIGIERQWRHKMAGLRTNVLVAVGAAVFCLMPSCVLRRLIRHGLPPRSPRASVSSVLA